MGWRGCWTSAGDGRTDLVVLDGPTSGFHGHDADEGWGPFRAFTASLNRDDSSSPDLRFVDLDGDGRADVLITEDDAFVWHRVARPRTASAPRCRVALERSTRRPAHASCSPTPRSRSTWPT